MFCISTPLYELIHHYHIARDGCTRTRTSPRSGPKSHVKERGHLTVTATSRLCDRPRWTGERGDRGYQGEIQTAEISRQVSRRPAWQRAVIRSTQRSKMPRLCIWATSQWMLQFRRGRLPSPPSKSLFLRISTFRQFRNSR